MLLWIRWYIAIQKVFSSNNHELQLLLLNTFCIALFSADSLRSCVILNEGASFNCAFFLISNEVVYLQHHLLVTWHVPCATSAISACFVYTIQPCTMSHHFMQSHIIMYGTCMLRCNLPPAILAEWPGSFLCYCCTMGEEWILKYKHWKLTMENKILPPLLPELKPKTFQSRVWCLNHWVAPAL